MGKWNLVREFAGNKLVDTVVGTYSKAVNRKHQLENEYDWKIVIYESLNE